MYRVCGSAALLSSSVYFALFDKHFLFNQEAAFFGYRYWDVGSIHCQITELNILGSTPNSQVYVER